MQNIPRPARKHTAWSNCTPGEKDLCREILQGSNKDAVVAGGTVHWPCWYFLQREHQQGSLTSSPCRRSSSSRSPSTGSSSSACQRIITAVSERSPVWFRFWGRGWCGGACRWLLRLTDGRSHLVTLPFLHALPALNLLPPLLFFQLSLLLFISFRLSIQLLLHLQPGCSHGFLSSDHFIWVCRCCLCGGEERANVEGKFLLQNIQKDAAK